MTSTRAFPATERIYIGGLDPSRLSVDEVVSRIESSLPTIQLTVSTSSSDDAVAGSDKTYFYVNAKHRTGETSQDETPSSSCLQIIAKQYHNVKWKGSKLRVEAARPHFLQRLIKEIKERQRHVKERTEDNRSADNPQPALAASTPRIPRHLRIRQRFGQEAHPVDTKSVKVDDWSRFSRAVGKMRLKRERFWSQKQSHEELPAVNKSHFNRSVHLRFQKPHDDDDEDDDDDQPTAHTNGIPTLADSDSSSTASLQTDNEDSASSDSSLDDESNSSVEKVRGRAYVWSDDDSLSSSNEQDLQHGQPESSESEEDSLPEKPHDWSSSKASEGIPENKKPVPSDDYLATMSVSSDHDNDDDSSTIDSTDDASAPDNDDIVESKNTDLYDDVKSNLTVLSSIFPEMSGAAPTEVRVAHNTTDNGNSESKIQTIQPGWEREQGSSISAQIGTMQRFDPTKESAQKYELESSPSANKGEEALEQDDVSREATAPDSDTTESQQDIALAEQPTSRAENVYQQDKLEDVFREARQTESGQATLGTDKQQGGGSFSFGFDFGESPSTKARNRDETGNKSNATGFSFAFDVGKDVGTGPSAQTPKRILDDIEKEREETTPMEEAASAIQVTKKSQFRRRGIVFPSNVLEQFTKDFFAMNDGTRIQADVEGFENDEEVKRWWLKERHTLTQDWKRKKKYAQSRQQKRTKFL